MTEEKKQSLHPVSQILCTVYNFLFDIKEVHFQLHEEHVDKLDSVVKTINATWFGVEQYPTLKDKAAAYFCLIIKAHAVTDGNKRLATMWLQIFCDSTKLELSLPNGIALDILAVSIEKSTLQLEKIIETTKGILFSENTIIK